MKDQRIVVGASHAGAELAVKLRQLDPATPVLLLGEEPVLPYQRPPLSKTWLGDPAAEVDKLLIRSAAAYEAAGVEVRTGAQVQQVDCGAARITLASGASLPYSQLALATGARPRRLQVPGTDRTEQAANYHYLRTHADALRLRPQFTAGRRIVIIGGGYIGLELAALAARTGLHTTVLEAQPRVLARVTAPQMSAFYERVHREAGVEVHTGVQVAGFDVSQEGLVRAVLWRNAEGRAGATPADVVAVGVGVVPNTELALAAGLTCNAEGLLVDELCRTSDPAIVAAGDCTARPVPGQLLPLRIESVPNAVEQARTAASTLCGQHVPCNAVPWFWSEQYDLRLQMAGLSRGHDEVVIRGDMSARAFTAFYLKQGALIAADSVNRPADFMLARKLVAAGARPGTETLANPATELKRLVAA